MAGEAKKEEIKEVFEGLTKMLLSLKEPMKELIDYVVRETSGGKLGGEVAAFYKSLIDGGVPEELASDMTRDYLKERLAIFRTFIEKTGTLNMPSTPEGMPRIIVTRKGGEEKKGEN